MADSSALILLSGGLDSTVNLFVAREFMAIKACLTIDYGQRAFVQEVAAARRSCDHFHLKHIVLDLKSVFADVKTSLVNRAFEVPHGEQVDIHSHSQSQKTAEKVWVPNRNGVLLNVAACVAESLNIDFVIPGFNLEEAQTFPDNSEQFIDCLNHAFSFSTMNRVQVQCFTHKFDKTKIYELAQQHKIPESFIWSCYLDGEKPCGQCESCLRFNRAKGAYRENHG